MVQYRAVWYRNVTYRTNANGRLEGYSKNSDVPQRQFGLPVPNLTVPWFDFATSSFTVVE
jgi:hypothetical protein